MKNSAMILDALKTGPGTSSELAADLGINPDSAAATLTKLRQYGLVVQKGRLFRGTRGRPCFLYALAQ